jgi:hypothetical protein
MTVRSLTLILVLSCLLPLEASAGNQPLKVTSSLDGKAALPHRITWVGYPSLAPSKVASVEFIVDGKMRWTEHTAPYIYGGDDAGKNRGYLVTSWLPAGNHRFAVKVTATDGRTGTDAFSARVLPPPPPPAGLAGTWKRTVTSTTAAPAAGTPGNPTSTFVPTGTYRLTFEPRWIRDNFPGQFVVPTSNRTGHGFIFLSDYTASASRIHVVGEVVFHPFDDKKAEGGSWCYVNGPAADYNWSVSGNTLTLAPVAGTDKCGIRGFIWAGDWTRVG